MRARRTGRRGSSGKDGIGAGPEAAHACFDLAPVPLLVGDLSAVKRRLDELRSAAAGGLRAYLEGHPAEVLHLGSLVRVVDVNREVLRLFGAGSVSELLRELPRRFAGSSLPVLVEGLVALGHGATRLDQEIPIRTIHGEERLVELSLRVSAGSEQTLASVVGSIHDVTTHRRVERLLKQERDRSHEVLDIAGVMLVVIGADERIRLVNKMACAVLGYGEEELVGKNWFETVLPDEERGRTRALFAEIMAGADEIHSRVENTVRTKRGEERTIAWCNTVLRDDEGRVIASLSSGEDVTEQRRMELALRANEEKLRVIAEHSLEWETWADPSGRLLWVNPAVERLTGYSVDECMAMSDYPLPIVFEGDRRLVAQWFKEAVQGGEGHDLEFRILRKDGSVGWGAVSWHQVYGSSGRPLGHQASVRDITERKRVEETLRESEERFRLTFDQSPIGAAIVSLDYRFLRVNDALCRITGYGADELIATGFPQITHPDDLDVDLQHGKRLASGEIDRYDTEKRYIRKDGSIVWVYLSVRLVRDGSGRSLYFLSTIQDITDRKRAEEHLREEARRKNEFLAMLSHELRNPLAPIRNSLFVLQRARPGGGSASRALSILDRQVEHLSRLVDDLLDVTRISRGKIPLQRTLVDLNELVRKVVEDHRAVFRASGVIQESRLGRQRLWIVADAVRITQVIGNLLTNAAKFTPRGGRVSVSVQGEGPTAALRVRDTGVGIPRDMLSQLFQPFAQAPQTVERSPGGLGLGLALVKALVELHAGTVTATSEGLGRGAEFVVRLPAVAAAHGEEHPTESRPVRCRRVLVIEDNVDAAESLKELLELLGHDVQVAYDGESGMRQARAFRPEVVLCDIGLPGMDGYAVAQAFRADASLADAVLVAVSGYALPEDKARAAQAGFSRHVAKPPSVEQLERVLEMA